MTEEALSGLAPRARLVFHLNAIARFVLFWVPVSIGLAIALASWWSVPGGLIGGLAFVLLQLLFAIWWPSLSFDRYTWGVGEEEVRIASGVIYRQVISIPLCRVQHVDVRQGPLEQIFGVSGVYIHTASGMGADGVIPGLLPDDAEALRLRLIRGAGGDDGV